MGHSLLKRIAARAGVVRRAVGLDIGAAALKVVEMEDCPNGRARLLHAATVLLPAGAVQNGQVVDPEAVVRTLRPMVADLGRGRRRTVVALPSRGVIRRPAVLAAPTADAAAQHARAQALSWSEIPEDRLVIDVQSVPANGQTPRQAPSRRMSEFETLVVMARREEVLSRWAVAEAVGLQPVAVDVAAFGQQRALAWSVAADPIAPTAAEASAAGVSLLIDVGHEAAALVACRRGEGFHDFEESPPLPSDSSPQEWAQVMFRWLERFRSAHPDHRMESVQLSGFGMDAVCPHLARLLALPVLPFGTRPPGAGAQPCPPSGSPISPSVALALGLALRGLQE